jgi:hypothetical protein
MASKPGTYRIIRVIAGRVSGHHFFDITARAPSGNLQPLGLILGGCDPAGPITEEALDVFGEAGVTESQVNGTSVRTQEPRAFFEVEVCARFGDARELVMNVLPIEMVVHEVH